MREDRRRHERFMIETAIRVSRRDPALVIDGHIQDMSADGVRIQCDATDAVMQIAIGDRVTLAAASDTCTGRVVRRKAGEIAIVYDQDDASSS